MGIFRFILVLALVSACGSFALYAATGKEKFKRFGWRIFKWTLVALLVFFIVLTIDRLR